MKLAFRVPGNPRGKGRPRASVRAGKPVLYTDAKTVAYEKAIASYALAQARMLGIKRPFISPVIDVTIVLRRPKRLCRKADPDERIICNGSKVDIDNVVKALLDGLQKSGLIVNDNTVTKLVARKLYGRKSPLELGCLEVRMSDDLAKVFDNEQALLALELV